MPVLVGVDRYEAHNIVWSYSDEATFYSTPAVLFTGLPVNNSLIMNHRITGYFPQSVLQHIDYAEELLAIFHDGKDEYQPQTL